MNSSFPPLSKEIPLWRKIQRKNFTKLSPLLDFLEVDPSLRGQLYFSPSFPLNVPLRLAQKMEKNNLHDPLVRQFLPFHEEQKKIEGYVSDPVEDLSFQKTPKLLHKYEGRALILATGACAMHCRYCFRQNFSYETVIPGFTEEIAYLRERPEIEEVILSGGDPLSLDHKNLEECLNSLENIPHLRRIRFHTRFPIGIPERIDAPLLSLLGQSQKQLYFVLHINHPNELDEEIFAAIRKLQKQGIVVLNQAVLLKGVNNDKVTLLCLCQILLNHGILPYYLHALDPVQGAAHFAVPQEEGEELIGYVQAHLSGFGVPRFVREEPGNSSKTWISSKKF